MRVGRHVQYDPAAGAQLLVCGVVNVSEHGLRTLTSITLNFPAGKQEAVDEGAPAAIVAAMTAHDREAAVAEQGCRAMRSIAFLPAGKSAIISAGGRAAIEAAVARHAAAEGPGTATLAALK